MTERSNIKFRASAVGALMVGGNGITDKQLQQLEELQSRKEAASRGEAKPLTAKMEEDLAALIEKRDAPFELSQTAKTFVREEWLRREFGFRDVVVTDEMLKGHICEQDSFSMISETCPAEEFRSKNKYRYENEWFTGYPDLVLKKSDFVEDVKSCWSLKTFLDKTSVEPIYFAQGQVYMDLTGKRNFRLHYCLNDTPRQLVENELRRFFWKYGGDEDNPDFLQASEQIERNHSFGEIPVSKRVRTFVFEYDPDYLSELKKRVEAARDYYLTLEL